MTVRLAVAEEFRAGGVRQYAKNMTQGPLTPAELDTARLVVRQAMRDGAFGLASALIYPPGNYASTEELIEEAKASAPYGGVYITHMRSEGDRLLEALDEAMRIGRDAGVPVEIYHLKAAGVKNWPKMRSVIATIDSARAAGQDVTVDQYPYTASSTSIRFGPKLLRMRSLIRTRAFPSLPDRPSCPSCRPRAPPACHRP